MELTELQQQIYDQLLAMGWDEAKALEVVLENVIEDENIEPIKFAISDRSSANWVLAKIAQNEKAINDIGKMFTDEFEWLKSKRERIAKKHSDNIAFFYAMYEEQLEEFAKGELAGRKEKSVSLLHGKIGFRKTSDAFIIDDEDTGIFELEIRCPEAVKKSILKSKISDEIKEIAEWGHVEPGEEKFYVKVGE